VALSTPQSGGSAVARGAARVILAVAGITLAIGLGLGFVVAVQRLRSESLPWLGRVIYVLAVAMLIGNSEKLTFNIFDLGYSIPI